MIVYKPRSVRMRVINEKSAFYKKVGTFHYQECGLYYVSFEGVKRPLGFARDEVEVVKEND